MIPSEVESLQDQLTEGSLEVGEFFAILLSTYEFDDSKAGLYSTLTHFSQRFQTKPILAMSSLVLFCLYKCTEAFQFPMCSHSLSPVTLKQFPLNVRGLNVLFLSCI